MDPKQHQTYQFLAAREALDPQRQTFLIIGNKPLLSQFREGELELFQLKVFDGEGQKAEWNTDKANVLEWRVDSCLAATSKESLKWLEKRSKSHEGGCFYITSALEVDLKAGGATSMGKATSRGALELYGEWDDISHDEQIKRIDELRAYGLDAHRVTSGNASVHWHIPFQSVIPWEIALPLLKQVTALMGSDVCCVSQARRMRLPGLWRRKGNKVTMQELISLTDQSYSVEEIQNVLKREFFRRGWEYAGRRWVQYRRAKNRLSAGRPLWSSAWADADFAWKCPEREIYSFVQNVGPRENGFDDACTIPYWLQSRHINGRLIQEAENAVFQKEGLRGAYELATKLGTLAQTKQLAGGEPFDFCFDVVQGDEDDRYPGVVHGNSPWSEENRSGSTFVVFGESRRWWCRKSQEGGTLSELLIHFCPGVQTPEEPSAAEQKLYMLWLQEAAGLDVEVANQKADDGNYAEDMLEIEQLVVDAIKAEGNPLQTAAVERNARKLGIQKAELLRLKLKQMGGEIRVSGVMEASESKPHPDNKNIPLITGFLERGNIGLSGDGGAGKTALMTFIAARVLKGHDVVISGRAHHTPVGRVLIISTDAGQESFENELIRQGIDIEAPGIKANLKFLTGDFTYADMGLLVTNLQEFMPDLVIMDSFVSMKAPGIKLADDDCAAPLYFLTKKNGYLWPKACIMTAIHTKKGSTSWLGSVAIKNALDALYSYSIPEELKESSANPPRILGVLDPSETKCRLGNRGRSWSFRYKDQEGTWLIDEIKDDNRGTTLSSQLRALIEVKPWIEWLQLTDVLERIEAGKEMRKPNAKKSIARYLQSMPDLIEADKRPDTKTNVNRMTTVYRVRPFIFQGLVEADSGYIYENVIGEAPQSSAAKAKAEVRSNRAKAEAKAAPKPRTKAPAKEEKSAASNGHHVVDPSQLLDWSKDQPPAKRTPMAVLKDGTWLNGYIFNELRGDQLMLLAPHPDYPGNYRNRTFPADPEIVKVVKKQGA